MTTGMMQVEPEQTQPAQTQMAATQPATTQPLTHQGQGTFSFSTPWQFVPSATTQGATTQATTQAGATQVGIPRPALPVPLEERTGQREPMTPQEMQRQVMTWSTVLIVLAIAGFAVMVMVRRYLKQGATVAGQDVGFSLSDLREMRDRGEITPAEYELTRARVIAKVKAKANEPPREKKRGKDEEQY